MDKETQVRLLKKLDITDMAGDKVMVDFESGKYFLLKGTAVDIWECIQTETTIGNILSKLQSIYDVDEETCLKGIISFIAQLQQNNFVELA